jgi:hypothetical protein
MVSIVIPLNDAQLKTVMEAAQKEDNVPRAAGAPLRNVNGCGSVIAA